MGVEKKELTVKQIEARLQEPFAEADIEWRVQQGGMKNNKPWAMILAYVNNRAIQSRLDEVLGIDGWCNEYKEVSGGFTCGLTIKSVNLTKWDGADNTSIEPTKGGCSNSMKRAAAQWGIGRYLYNLPVAFAVFPEKGKGKYRGKFKDEQKKEHWLYWNPTTLPTWALPNSEKGDPVQWAYQNREIEKICKDLGMMRKDVCDAVFAGNFETKKVLAYLHELEDAKFEEQNKEG